MKMMKRIALMAVLAVMVLCGTAGVSRAEIIPAYGEGQIGLSAVVLCESLTVRASRSTASAAVETLNYGTRFAVQNAENGWAQVFLSDAVDAGPSGWVNTDYIAIDPAWYRFGTATPVYAWGDTDAPKVALLSKGDLVPILKDEGDWLVISLRGASGWIRKTAADR